MLSAIGQFIEVYVSKCRFLLRFNVKEEEVNLLGDGTEKPEFGEWSWLSPEEVVNRVSAAS